MRNWNFWNGFSLHSNIEEEYTERNAKIRIPLNQQTYTFKEDYTLYNEKDFF
ncbi:hypothetical protein K5688_001260 [Campylobacter lari]|nr:hypothetical protein [Campylobacter lari]